MKNQRKLLEERNWDNLILLDACRYDYFKSSYGDSLAGDLEKTSRDIPWREKIIKCKKMRSTVYFSAHPNINSKGIEAIKGFNARKYLFKVIDVWDQWWDNRMGTVLPTSFLKMRRKIEKHSDKNLIFHFIQPHYPYLSLGPEQPRIQGSIKIKKEKEEKNCLSEIKRLPWRFSRQILGQKETVKIKRKLGFSNPNTVRMVAQKYGGAETLFVGLGISNFSFFNSRGGHNFRVHLE